jgi:hypothetical protein
MPDVLHVLGGGQRLGVGQCEAGVSADLRRATGERRVDRDHVDREVPDHGFDVVARLGAGALPVTARVPATQIRARRGRGTPAGPPRSEEPNLALRRGLFQI